MKNKVIKLFVYGSLRKGFHADAYTYISEHFTLLGEAKVKGRLYYTGEYPAAIPCEDETYIVGELYELKKESEFAWAIGQLDDYEGTDPTEGEKQLYRREITEVIFDNSKLPAWIYWFNGDVAGNISIPSGDILDYICGQSK